MTGKELLLATILMEGIKVCVGLTENGHLSKKYTLRFPMFLPIGGPIAPMGGLCTEGIDLFVQKVNAQHRILKDYNVVVDIIDDQCRSNIAVKKLVPEFENWKAVAAIGDNSNSYIASLPIHPVVVQKTANVTYTPPMILGSICSGVCKVIGKFPQHYKLIEVTNGCIEIAMNDKRKYPSFFRFYRSTMDYSYTRKALTSHLKLTRVAVLSDATQFTYSDATFFINVLSQGNSSVEIAAEEFFQVDPTEALSRLKKQDIRIIFAICYVNNCPAIACAAYKMNYYGPNMVWIFNSEAELVRSAIKRPEGCDKSMTDKFAEGVIMIGVDLTAITSKGIASDFGVTGDQVTEHIGQESPASLNLGSASWRFMCFEMIHSAIHIAEDVEQMLNQNNDTLANALSKPSGMFSITDEFRRAALNVDFEAIWGRVKLRKDLPDMNLFESPAMVILQLQDLRRVVVLVDKGDTLTQFGNNKFQWLTSDGNPPKSKPTLTYQKIETPAVARKVSLSLSVASLCGIMVSIHRTIKARNLEISVTFFGALMIVISNILYTDDAKYPSKCAMVTVFLLIGFAIVVASLSMTLAIAFFFRRNRILVEPGRRDRIIALLLIVWLFLNICLVAVMMADYDLGKPELITVEKMEFTEPLAENITISTWQACYSKNFIFGYVIIGIQSAMAVFGVFCGLLTHHQATARLMGDVPNVRISLYIIVPLTAALLMIELVVQHHSIVLITLNIFSIGLALLLVALFRDTIPVHHVSVATASVRHSSHPPKKRSTRKPHVSAM